MGFGMGFAFGFAAGFVGGLALGFLVGTSETPARPLVPAMSPVSSRPTSTRATSRSRTRPWPGWKRRMLYGRAASRLARFKRKVVDARNALAHARKAQV